MATLPLDAMRGGEMNGYPESAGRREPDFCEKKTESGKSDFSNESTGNETKTRERTHLDETVEMAAIAPMSLDRIGSSMIPTAIATPSKVLRGFTAALPISR